MSLLDPDRLARLYGQKPASKPKEKAQIILREKCCKRAKGELRCEDCPLR
jgi:hypothetical protein